MSSSAYFLKSGFMLAVSRNTLPSIYQPPESLSPRRGLTISPRCGRDTLPSICKRWYLPSPAGVQLLRAATRSLLAHFYYTQNTAEYQHILQKIFCKFFATDLWALGRFSLNGLFESIITRLSSPLWMTTTASILFQCPVTVRKETKESQRDFILIFLRVLYVFRSGNISLLCILLPQRQISSVWVLYKSFIPFLFTVSRI